MSIYKDFIKTNRVRVEGATTLEVEDILLENLTRKQFMRLDSLLKATASLGGIVAVSFSPSGNLDVDWEVTASGKNWIEDVQVCHAFVRARIGKRGAVSHILMRDFFATESYLNTSRGTNKAYYWSEFLITVNRQIRSHELTLENKAA